MKNFSQETIEYVAEACHEVNRAHCRLSGDYSQPTWYAAPEWARNSAILGVRGVIDGNGPDESHNSWLKQKTEEGWSYGPVKDINAKIHPCFVSYDKLPPTQRWKDVLFVTTARNLLQIHQDKPIKTY